jgi:hypothetical protein
VELLNNILRQPFTGNIKDVIETGEVISGFDNIIDIGGFTGFGIDGICFINAADLFFRKPAAFNPVGIIAELYPGKMINSPFEPHPAFFP